MTRHIRVVHFGQKKYLCTYCGRNFGQNQDLKFHVNARHADEMAKDKEREKETK